MERIALVSFRAIPTTFLLILTLASCGSFGDLSPKEVFKRVAPSVFIVEYRGDYSLYGTKPIFIGSGVAVGRDEVVTNSHVVQEFPGLIKVRQGEKAWRAFVCYFDSENDLCILKVPGLNANFRQPNAQIEVKVGDKVFAIGAPKGLELSLSDGLISGLRNPDEKRRSRVIQTTAPISPGSSGGGLFDSKANLIGITTAYIREGQNLNFAIDIDTVSKAITIARTEVHQLLVQSIAYLQAGDLEKAKEPIQRVLALSPNLAEAWYISYLVAAAVQERSGSGSKKKPQNELDENKAFLEKAVKLKPSFAEAWFSLAEIHYEIGDKQHSRWSSDRLGRFIDEVSKRGWARAHMFENDVQGHFPPEPTYHYEQANAMLEKAVQAAPTNVRYQVFYSSKCFELGRCDEGLATINLVLQLDPQNLFGLDQLATYYSRAKNNNRFLKIWVQILKGKPRASQDCSIQQGMYEALDTVCKMPSKDRGDVFDRLCKTVGDEMGTTDYEAELARLKDLVAKFMREEKIAKEGDENEAQDLLPYLREG